MLEQEVHRVITLPQVRHVEVFRVRYSPAVLLQTHSLVALRMNGARQLIHDPPFPQARHSGRQD